MISVASTMPALKKERRLKGFIVDRHFNLSFRYSCFCLHKNVYYHSFHVWRFFARISFNRLLLGSRGKISSIINSTIVMEVGLCYSYCYYYDIIFVAFQLNCIPYSV